MKSSTHEFTIVGALLFFAFLFFNPFDFWMPNTVTLLMAGGLVVVFAVFAGVVLHEKPEDEREVSHTMNASRTGYLLGLTIVVLGIVVEALTAYRIDPWLIAALVVMAAGKLVTSFYLKRFK